MLHSERAIIVEKKTKKKKKLRQEIYEEGKTEETKEVSAMVQIDINKEKVDKTTEEEEKKEEEEKIVIWGMTKRKEKVGDPEDEYSPGMKGRGKGEILERKRKKLTSSVQQRVKEELEEEKYSKVSLEKQERSLPRTEYGYSEYEQSANKYGGFSSRKGTLNIENKKPFPVSESKCEYK